ncbi:hypothetical protein HZM05_002823 [Salmonella enterica]|nr:hypothetical protein [Salmonella enterica]
MRKNNVQDLDPFSPEKLVKDFGKPELGGKTSSLLLAAEHLAPEELAILARTLANKTQPFLDETQPFSQNVLDQFRQMHP